MNECHNRPSQQRHLQLLPFPFLEVLVSGSDNLIYLGLIQFEMVEDVEDYGGYRANCRLLISDNRARGTYTRNTRDNRYDML